MRTWSRLLGFVLILIPGSLLAADGTENCERGAIAEAIRMSTLELSPAEMYAAQVKVESVENAGIEVFGDYSIIQYLVTVRLNEESRVVYSVRTKMSRNSCPVLRATTYRRRAEY